MSNAPFTVAIDGPAAAGKGTLSRAVAAHFGFAHLDTGLLYRAVGKATLDRGRGTIDPVAAEELAKRLDVTQLDESVLRTALIARAASRVAALPGVRAALVEVQRSFARRAGGAVLDGRDIGTAICPQADVKIFVTASDTVRAQRRFEELTAKGADTTRERVLEDLKTRDARDAQRETAPMARADDAHLLDTTELSIDAAIETAVAIINRTYRQGRT
ncbi:MAG: (d)CMP kinase [Pseudomonadota bacterium]